MKNFLAKYDRPLRILDVLTTWLIVLIGLITFILGCVFMDEGEGLLIWLIGALIAGLTYLGCKVVISYLYDIKLIRNKLYNISNDELLKKETVE